MRTYWSKGFSFWKICASYLRAIYIDHCESSWNGYLELRLVHGCLQLNYLGSIYSQGLRYDNFRLCFRKMQMSKFRGGEICLLGMGLASILEIGETQYQLDAAYTGVEPDTAVVHWATQYVLPHYQVPKQIITGDAFQFLSSTAQQWDLICVDIYRYGRIPEEFQTLEFCWLLQDHLLEGGCCIYNVAAHTKDLDLMAKSFFEGVFQAVFPEAVSIPVLDNYMLISHGSYLHST